jgi:glycosyltransferase involved in cell wall biosynthesis
LCFRARKSGYRNVLNTGLFVYHKHGGSFDNAEKIKLLNENQQKIERMHPDFTPVLQRYFKENTFILIKLVYFLKLLKKEGKRISLFLDHDLGGGTNQYSKNYLSEHESSVFLYGQYINPNRNPGKQILFSINYKNYHFRFGLDTVNTLFQLIGRYTISLDEIIINNLVSYNNALVVAKEVVDYKKIHNTSLKVLCHDFYYICPNFLLFINNTEFCGVPEEVAVCNKCISSLATSIDPKLIPNDFVSITQWRTAWKSLLLDHADIVVMFSESTKAIFTKVWPSLEKKSVVIPHSLKGFKKYEGQLYRIGILGNIHSVAKGAKVVQDLAAYIERNNLYNFRLINFGGIHPLYDHNLIEKKGPYTLDDIHYQLLDNKIDVILIPSVCSETFSFTTREAIETGIPTACFKIGGQYDQIKNYNKGIVAGEIRPEAVLEAIINYFKLQKNEAV